MRKIHQGVEYFDELEVSARVFTSHEKPYSEDESDAKIFSVPYSKTGQQSSPHIQLKLMRRQPQQGNADENNFETTLSHGDQSFPQYFYNVICKCTIKTFLDDSNLNAFQTF